jgi:hypothetical protein
MDRADRDLRDPVVYRDGRCGVAIGQLHGAAGTERQRRRMVGREPVDVHGQRLDRAQLRGRNRIRAQSHDVRAYPVRR